MVMLEADLEHLDEMGSDVSEFLIRELKLPVYGIENIADRLRSISIRNRGHGCWLWRTRCGASDEPGSSYAQLDE
jgi:hypothetical protein